MEEHRVLFFFFFLLLLVQYGPNLVAGVGIRFDSTKFTHLTRDEAS